MVYLLKALAVIETLLCLGMITYAVCLPRPARARVFSFKVVAIVLLVPAVGLFCRNIYLFELFLLLAVGLNSRSRSELASIYLLVVPLMPALVEGVSVGGAYLGQLSAISAVNAGAFLGFALSRKRPVSGHALYDLLIVALLLVLSLTYTNEMSLSGVLRAVVTLLISYGAPYLLLSRAIASRDDAELIFRRFLLGVTLVAVVAVFQATKHWIVYQDFYTALGVEVPLQSWTLAMREGFVRTGGSMLDYSAAGVYFSAGVCAVIALRGLHHRAGWLLLLAISLAGLFATQSRGGWAATVFGVVLLLLYRRRFGAAALIAGAVVAFEGVIILSGISGTLGRILGNTGDANGSVDYRQQLLSQGLKQVAEHPLFGQTQTRLVENLADLTQGQHIVDFVNGHLFVAMTAGVPLFLLWLTIWLTPIVRVMKVRRARYANPTFVEVPLVLLAPPLVALIATSIIDRNLLWPVIGLAIAGPIVTISRSATSAIATAPRWSLVAALNRGATAGPGDVAGQPAA